MLSNESASRPSIKTVKSFLEDYKGRGVKPKKKKKHKKHRDEGTYDLFDT